MRISDLSSDVCSSDLAYPILVITGALLDTGAYSAFTLLCVAVFGALLADFGWYLAGQRYGRRMLSALCRISLSPDSCVRQTESIYLRWGPPSLMVAKFIDRKSTRLNSSH